MASQAVLYATASVEAVAAFVAERYDLRGPVRCAPLNRGFNDTYEVLEEAGDRHVFRLSGHRARGPADVAAETAFLAWLDAAGVPVAAAVPTRNGALSTIATMSDGERPAVLFATPAAAPPTSTIGATRARRGSRSHACTTPPTPGRSANPDVTGSTSTTCCIGRRAGCGRSTSTRRTRSATFRRSRPGSRRRWRGSTAR